MPSLPDDVVVKTREKYVEAFRRLTGRELDVTVISERLEKLVEEMVDKGVQFEDAVREFEKRFISRVLDAVRRQPDQNGRHARHPPQHAHAKDGRIQDQAANRRAVPVPIQASLVVELGASDRCP